MLKEKERRRGFTPDGQERCKQKGKVASKSCKAITITLNEAYGRHMMAARWSEVVREQEEGKVSTLDCFVSHRQSREVVQSLSTRRPYHTLKPWLLVLRGREPAGPLGARWSPD